jgi:hypothetical protein
MTHKQEWITLTLITASFGYEKDMDSGFLEKPLYS